MEDTGILDKYSHITGADDWVMCFFAVSHSEETYIKEQIMAHKSPAGRYMYSLETAEESHTQVGGEHFHILIQTDADGYKKLAKNICTRYKLQGQAKDGKARQYGKVRKKIRVHEAISYTGKDGIWDSDLPAELVEYLHTKSYQKTAHQPEDTVNKRKATKSWSERVVDELMEPNPKHKWNHYRDKEIIINKMLVMLGRQAKKISRKIIYEMYWGIYNALPKEYSDHQRIVESMVDAVDDHI